MRPAQRPALHALLGTAHQGPPLPAGDRPEAEERLALRVPALARRYRALLERRSPWDTAWESLAEHFLPTRFRTDDSPDDRPLLNRSLVDATGILAMRTLAAGLQGGMTSPARPWFRLALDDPELSRSHAGQRYLDEVEARMRVVLQRCNFYNAMHTIYAELGTFGTAFVFELADLRHGFRFVPLCAGQYVLDTDAARRVDTVFHRMHMSLRQMVQSFGLEALPENLRLAANDVYGRSPAMDALPDCRMLQQMGITTLKAIHKAVDPPMSVHAGLRSVGLDLTPGGINFVDSLPGQNQPVATPLLQVKPDLAQARSAMEAVQQQIRAGLYNDLFRLILEGRSKVTASEIAAREEEKLLLIGPVLERLHDELLIPLIDRTFRLMLALDMLPPCPPELSGRHLKVEFVSLLAQAQKLVGISATDQYLALTLKAASAWPEAPDSVDVDNLLDNYAQSLGLPANLTRPREERARLRAGREEARQAEQQLELLQKAADLGHTLADSDLTVEGEKSSVLQVLANLAAGAAPALRPQQTSGTTPPPEGGHDAR